MEEYINANTHRHSTPLLEECNAPSSTLINNDTTDIDKNKKSKNELFFLIEDEDVDGSDDEDQFKLHDGSENEYIHEMNPFSPRLSDFAKLQSKEILLQQQQQENDLASDIQISLENVEYNHERLGRKKITSDVNIPLDCRNSNSNTNSNATLLMILDIDETIIHSFILPEGVTDDEPKLDNQQQQQSTDDIGENSKMQMQREYDEYLLTGGFGCCHRVSSYLFEFDGNVIRTGRLVMILRPGLMEMLNNLATEFTLGIFSAATGPYVGLVMSAIDPDSALFGDRVACRDDMVDNGVCVSKKNLPEKWGWNPAYTIIIDDNIDMWNRYAGYSIIRIDPFNSTDMNTALSSSTTIDSKCSKLSKLSSAFIAAVSIARVKSEIFECDITAHSVVVELYRFNLDGIASVVPQSQFIARQQQQQQQKMRNDDDTAVVQQMYIPNSSSDIVISKYFATNIALSTSGKNNTGIIVF